jgi:hypothetical protein
MMLNSIGTELLLPFPGMICSGWVSEAPRFAETAAYREAWLGSSPSIEFGKEAWVEFLRVPAYHRTPLLLKSRYGVL